MPYCGYLGCGCCTCEVCGRYKEDCVCDLRRRTREFVDGRVMGDNTDLLDYADSLFEEWLLT